jgi:hypothetical protein
MIDADEWPYSFNTIAPAAQLHALGQITLVFNYLEESIGNIFKVAMPTNSAFSEAMYHKLNNRDRVDLLAAIVRESSKEDDIKEAILHLLTCYSICADNRNILMHAILESADADIISLSKKASRDPTRLIEFRIPLVDLRAVADEMAKTFVYAMRLQSAMDARSRPKTELSGLIPRSFQTDGMLESFAALPSQPPKPKALTPYQASATQGAEFTPQSSED